MRRQKRDMSSRAFDRGYQAGMTGRSSDACPHSNGEQRMSWISGWREGHDDHQAGLTGVSGVHRLRMS